MRLLIGIDPGTKTGVAVWDPKAQAFARLTTTGIVGAMEIVEDLRACHDIKVFFEDARQRKFFADKGVEALQGAGSIKRDCSIWEEFLRVKGIDFVAVHPVHNVTKVGAALFQRLTKVDARVSEHARDAAMLVFKLK